MSSRDEWVLRREGRYAASVVMSMTYGKTEPTYYTDPEVLAIGVHGTRLGKVAQVGAHVVDNYPILRHVPFVTKTLRQWHQEELALFTSQVNGVRTKIVREILCRTASSSQIYSFTGKSRRAPVFRDLFAGAPAGIRS